VCGCPLSLLLVPLSVPGAPARGPTGPMTITTASTATERFQDSGHTPISNLSLAVRVRDTWRMAHRTGPGGGIAAERPCRQPLAGIGRPAGLRNETCPTHARQDSSDTARESPHAHENTDCRTPRRGQ
jgi:hypothetical protein